MSERDATGRFEIQHSFTNDRRIYDNVTRQLLYLSDEQAEALRDLLNRTFPLAHAGATYGPPATDPVAHDCEAVVRQRHYTPEPQAQQQPADEPELDDEEVRRACERVEQIVGYVGMHSLQPFAKGLLPAMRAARAYLRMREQCPATFTGQRCSKPNLHHGLHDNQQQPVDTIECSNCKSDVLIEDLASLDLALAYCGNCKDWPARKQQPAPAPTFDFARVLAWARSADHSKAHVAFTAGIEREVADLIEMLTVAPPSPTIAQVVEACGGDQVTVMAAWCGEWCAKVRSGVVEIASAFSDTPEAALLALYDDAVQRLRYQRDQADEKLRKLEGR